MNKNAKRGIIALLLTLWMGFWSSESGASFPWSKHWQNIKEWFSEVPEVVFALTVAVSGILGLNAKVHTSIWLDIPLFIAFALIAYAGKQAATWAYLTWTGHKNPSTTRGATIKPVVDAIAWVFSYKLGDEGYSWVWAAVKGFILTIPICGIGLITFPLGHELGSHAKGRLPGDPNMWKEFFSGAAIGMSCAIFLLITGVI